jgi:hypothetical protein
MNVEELSPEDRKLLQKKSFILWTVYKRMLICLAVFIGSIWIWTGWEALYDTHLINIFIIITIVVVVLLAFAWFSTPIYRKKTALPLEKDLLQNKKICKTGIVIAIERENKYNNRIVFQEQGQIGTEVFTLNDRFPDLYVLNREIYLEHSPEARLILQARLLVPFTEEEAKQMSRQERIDTIAVFMLVGIITLAIGWYFNLLLFMFIIYLVVIGVISGFIWWDKLKAGREKRRAVNIVTTIIANIVATFLFLVLYKLASQLIWNLEDWLGWSDDMRSYLLMGIIYIFFSFAVNTILWYYIKGNKSG